MSTRFNPQPIARGPRRRHQARVQKFSADPVLLAYLDGLAISDSEVPPVVDAVCLAMGVESPRLRFHARRSPYTGATEQPRWWLIDLYGEDRIRSIERDGNRTLPQHGAIRLGRTTTLMTVAHELGHHLVFVLDPLATPAHGRRWVHRFDQAAKKIRALI
ncbi:MAG: hypothetical protein DRJ28_00240 [Actinobacteria bacterium]|nr:MAG: hypothetical protein DRJ28_00240 [Actinomycetota bacterium]